MYVYSRKCQNFNHNVNWKLICFNWNVVYIIHLFFVLGTMIVLVSIVLSIKIRFFFSETYLIYVSLIKLTKNVVFQRDIHAKLYISL